MAIVSSKLVSGSSTTAIVEPRFARTGLDPQTQIVMPFQSLLLQITKHLYFPDPQYKLVDVQTNSAAVFVYTDSRTGVYNYVGGPAVNIHKSCQKAAQIVVHDMMERFNVWVEDISISKRREFERCAGLYRLKWQEIRNLSKGIEGVPLLERLARGAPIGSEPVIVDFTAILRSILRKCNINNTGLETIAHGRSRYTAWITITSLKGNCGSKTFFSVRCDDIENSKNSLAKTVIEYLIPIYNLVIIDANYDPKLTAHAAFLCALEMESYFAAKERVLGMEIITATPSLLLTKKRSAEQNLRLKIPTMISEPVPPKKRPYKTTSMKMSAQAKMLTG